MLVVQVVVVVVVVVVEREELDGLDLDLDRRRSSFNSSVPDEVEEKHLAAYLLRLLSGMRIVQYARSRICPFQPARRPRLLMVTNDFTESTTASNARMGH